jgi:pyruvate dehydrogenase E2 component (dihydrolipoamide acetyltransferase)
VSATRESLDYAERWLRDGLYVLRPPASVYGTTVDMTTALATLERLRRAGINATSTHLLIRAAARALADNPDLHQLVAGTRRRRGGRVDIGLSVLGETFVAPVLVIEGADGKDIKALVEEIATRTPQVREADKALLGMLRTWGWLVPWAFLRRALLRTLFRSAEFRRRGAGTFQISTVPVDWASSSSFATAGVLIAGRISSQVVAVEGQPAVRPIVNLTLSSDHGIWDGRAAARFLAAVRVCLEEPVEV